MDLYKSYLTDLYLSMMVSVNITENVIKSYIYIKENRNTFLDFKMYFETINSLCIDSQQLK